MAPSRRNLKWQLEMPRTHKSPVDRIQHDIPKDHRICIREWMRWLLLLIISIALVGVIYPWDLTLSRFFSQIEIWPGDTRRIIAMAEYMAHGTGVLVILTVIWMLVPDKRLFLPRIAASAFLGGLAANLLKMCFARRRPLMTDVGVTDIDITWAAYARGMPIGADGYFDYAWQSFPSAHTATAVGFAIGLTWLFPKGKYVFWGMAAMAGLQRIVFMAHWPTDVMAGVCLGIFSGFCFAVPGTQGNRFFSDWESRFQRISNKNHPDTESESERQAA